MSVMVNSEDGKLYRWDLSTNTLSEMITLSPGIGEAYTPTIIGPDGTVYAINAAILNAVGRQTIGTTLSINDVSVTEGNGGTTTALFTVSLSAASTDTVSVHYASADGTATMADNDYVSAAGTLTFGPGETSKTIAVAVAGDTKLEATETFVVNLSSPVNATIADGQGQGTIVNDDSAPSLAIGDVTVNEGNSGVTNAIFSVTLSAASSQTVTVNYATADGSAKVATRDYAAVSGTLTFAPGQTTQTIAVPVIGDKRKEKDETFFVNLSGPSNATIADGQGRGTITNDD